MNHLKFHNDDIKDMNLDDLELRLAHVIDILAYEEGWARRNDRGDSDSDELWELVVDYRREKRAIERMIDKLTGVSK